jgi:selenocysteine lyase/cysteine desulfurase
LKQENPLIYLNNAATSWPKPPEVIQAVQESLELPFGGGEGELAEYRGII